MTLVTKGDRPSIFDYTTLEAFMIAMLEWRRQGDQRFSVRQAAKQIGCAPSLISQVVAGKRSLTRDRVDAFAELLQLNLRERHYLDRWVAETRAPTKDTVAPVSPSSGRKPAQSPRNHLLSDWLHAYVKDASKLRGFVPNPLRIYRLLGGLASEQQIARSLQWLMQQGFLLKSASGKLVPQEPLTVTTDEIPVADIRSFHKKALTIAKDAIDLYPPSRREASTLLMVLNDDSFKQLKEMTKEFRDRLEAFIETHSTESHGMYQVTIHLTPIGGRHDD